LKADGSGGNRPRVLSVPAVHAQELLRELRSHRLVDRTRKIVKHEGRVLVPVVAEPTVDLGPFAARWEEGGTVPPRTVLRDPWDRIQEGLRAAEIPIALAPRRWKRIGDVVFLRMPQVSREAAPVIAQVFGTTLGAQTVVEERSGIHGPLRTPDVRVLWGDGTETVHIEGGVRFSLDVAKVMFSPGNVEERIGIADRIRPGAVVVDLFAGIGYFSLPIAVRRQPEAVYACELNPVSYGYLLRNIRLNRAERVIPLHGNCRDFAPRGVADWVIMGHFDAREYLDIAFAALRGKGTIVYHELCPKEQYPEGLARRLAASSRAHWLEVRSIRTRIVKSYAPGIVHAAAEVAVTPQIRTSGPK
jgi:tRNA wybutosine-synthesizing protein 2